MFSFACRAWKRRNVWRQRQNRNVDRVRMLLLWIKSSKTKACRIVARRPLLPHRLACGPWNKWAILNFVLGLRRSAGSICSLRESCRTRFLVVTVVLNRWQKWIERRMDLWNAKFWLLYSTDVDLASRSIHSVAQSSSPVSWKAKTELKMLNFHSCPRLIFLT